MASDEIWGERVFKKPARGPGLDDPYLKTTRAKVHLEGLRAELQLFLESNPYSFIGEDDVENGLYRLRIEVKDTPDPICLIVGDVFYCLRASLDQLVWSLAKLTVLDPIGTQFPIMDCWDLDSQKRFKRYTRGVPAEAVHIIDSLQPHHGGNPKANLLWQLNAMCNTDKHRRIPVNGSATEFRFPNTTESLAPFLAFEDDCIVVPAAFKGQMALDPKISFNVRFGDTAKGVSCDFDGIERIYNLVTDSVIPRFARFFK